ncbi:MAG: DUF3501 family protein [Nitrosomonas sp.]|nr:DUF3501 family protein [Nitrosomonas sp.]
MSSREGSLEAPKRNPIDWQNPDFYDEQQLFEEMFRVFDICHGCRRCVNLCTTFPSLFDLIDDGKTGELDGVEKQDLWQVVDRCYLCDMCFMTKCPYVPPHPWNIDFPHLMLRAKAIKYKKQGASLRDRLLSSTDTLGKLATIPVIVQTTNAITQTPATRKIFSKALGIHPERELPTYSSRKFRTHANPDEHFAPIPSCNVPGKVAIYATCYINYNEPGIGHDLLWILAHNEIPAKLVAQEACCGMPKLELGDLDSVAALKDRNIPHLSNLAREGYAILTAVPSCTLMYKQELPLLFPEDEAVAMVADAMFDPFEYLMLLNREGLLKTDFQYALGKVAYHIPCHLRVQNLGRKTRDLLQLIPGTEVTTVERCSGHDGTWGVKQEFFDDSMKIGQPVFRQMGEAEPDYISSDCAIAARHIQQGMKPRQTVKHHPLSLLRIAYGETQNQPLSAQSVPAAGSISHSPGNIMPKITRDSLLTLEAYAKNRESFRAEIMAHKKNRSVALGEHVTLLFEDELTMRYQIQEMLRAEKIFEDADIQQELDVYNPLVPDGSNWKATMLIEYGDPVERAKKLTQLIGIENQVWVNVAGHPRIYGMADEDLDRTNAEKTSAVHFLRFELSPEIVQALQQGAALGMGIDHSAYQITIQPIADNIQKALMRDLA